jgi:L-lactate utilization protein LutB
MPSATEQAVRQLEAALQSLEYAVEQRLSQSAGADGLAEQVQMLTSARAELAETLDQAEARAAKLDHINRDVARRLDSAIAAIRAVLQSDEEGG